MTRRALHDDELGGYAVAAGMEIHLPTYFIQRHPGLWQQPDLFDPDRFESGKTGARHKLAMLPFSAGPRNCIGELLARVEMQTHLAMATRRLRMRYPNPKPLDLEFSVNLRNRFDFIMSPETIQN